MDRTSNTPHGTGGDAVRGDRRFQPPGAVVADRPEQRAPFVEAMPGRVEVVVDQPMGAGVRVLPPLPETFRCGTPLRACRKSVTCSLHSSSRRSAWNSSVERMARSRRLLTVSSWGASSNLRAWWSPIAGVLPSPLSVLGRSTPLTGLWVTAFFSQRYSNSEASAASRRRICRAAEPAPAQLIAPGDQMRARHGAEFFRTPDAGEVHEILHRVFIGAAGVGRRGWRTTRPRAARRRGGGTRRLSGAGRRTRLGSEADRWAWFHLNLDRLGGLRAGGKPDYRGLITAGVRAGATCPACPFWAAFFMGAADNPVGHDNRLGSGLGDECQHFFRHPDVVADVGLLLREPASKVGRLGVLGRHNGDRELGRRAIVRAVERDRCDRPAAKSFLGPFAQSFAGALQVEPFEGV